MTPRNSTPVCGKREPIASGCCKHLLRTGVCELPDELMCVEFMPPECQATPGTDSPQSHSLKLQPTLSPMSFFARSAQIQPPVDSNRLRGFTTEDIDSFKALGLEVCLQSDSFGELWLVPAYTGQSRRELTPEHAATLLHMLTVFPDSHVVGFNTKPTDARNEGNDR